MKVAMAGASDRGRVRDRNEDAFLVGADVAAVADGVGGRQAGEVASKTALRCVAALDGVAFDDVDGAADALCAAVDSAHRHVVQEASRAANRRGMSTTLTAVIVHHCAIVLTHVGDSRAYLVRAGGRMTQLTSDHTMVAEMVDMGTVHREAVTRHPWRNVITRAIGVGEAVEVDRIGPVELAPGDQMLLCSDGLTDVASDDDIMQLIDPAVAHDKVVQALIELANERGGPDNVTVVLLRAVDDGAVVSTLT